MMGGAVEVSGRGVGSGMRYSELTQLEGVSSEGGPVMGWLEN